MRLELGLKAFDLVRDNADKLGTPSTSGLYYAARIDATDFRLGSGTTATVYTDVPFADDGFTSLPSQLTTIFQHDGASDDITNARKVGFLNLAHAFQIAIDPFEEEAAFGSVKQLGVSSRRTLSGRRLLQSGAIFIEPSQEKLQGLANVTLDALARTI